MVYNKKAFRKAAAEIAQKNGITFRRAKQILAYAIHLKEQAEETQSEKQRPSAEIKGIWKNIIPES